MARNPRPTRGNRDETIPGKRSSNPMGVSPDHEFSTEPLSKGALAAKKKNTK
ncbi:small, acid-soluble spore protein L [Anaerobacillus arseniciselenatis]|uniref:small, acid-soluble spore protein L n=1 Tax=Anaerobacillus arseniciselenatis TaxID=85682 RepID=UPI0011135E99|nr:small, acid-soluble spore protein L [Anaerobacillus arseniciselenatis]